MISAYCHGPYDCCELLLQHDERDADYAIALFRAGADRREQARAYVPALHMVQSSAYEDQNAKWQKYRSQEVRLANHVRSSKENHVQRQE